MLMLWRIALRVALIVSKRQRACGVVVKSTDSDFPPRCTTTLSRDLTQITYLFHVSVIHFINNLGTE